MRRGFLERLRRPRTLVLLALLVLLIAVRAALPTIVREVAVSQADGALVGRISLADVDLSLLRGGVALHDVAVYAEELPPPTGSDGAPSPSAAVAQPASGDAPLLEETSARRAGEPLATIGRLWVRIGWLPLLRKTVEVAEVELDDFVVRLDRARDGALVLPRPVPVEAPEEDEEPEPSGEGPGWGVRVTSVRLRNGLVGFRDFGAAQEPEPFELAIDDVTAGNLALTVGSEADEPGHVTLDARIGEGSFALDSRVTMLDAGPRAESTVTLRDLPIGGTQVYLRALGWSEVGGLLDADVQHTFDAAGVHTASGTISLRDLVIDVPGHDAAALAWSRLDVELGALDLTKRDAEVSRVVLAGLRMPLRPNEPARAIPLLHEVLGEDEDDDEASATEPATEAAAPDAAAAAARARADAPAHAPTTDATPADADATQPPAEGHGGGWTWRVGELRLDDATLDLLRADQATPLGVRVELRNLSSDASARSELALGLTPPEGSVEVAGGVVRRPLSFDGTLRVTGLSLPELLAPLEQPAVALLRAGVLDAELRVALGPPSDAGEGAARVRGTIGLDRFELGEPPPRGDAFGVAWKSLALELGDVVVPGALGGDAAQPLRASVERVELVEPAVRVTRTAKGIVLPAALGGDAAERAAPGALSPPAQPSAAPATDGPAAAETPDAVARPAATPVEVSVARASIARGRIRVEDRSVRPTYRNEIAPLDLRASRIRWPGPTVGELRLDAATEGGARMRVTGSVRERGADLTVTVDALPLEPLNPYAAGTGYGVGGGSASLESKLSMKGDTFEASSRVVVSDLTVTGEQGEALFAQQFGIPLSLALALLTDLEGKISLDVPLSGDRSGASVDVGSLVAQALAQAILGAITSPLKLIMAVGTVDGKVASTPPQAIRFRPGRAEVAPGGEELVERLASLLKRSPALRIELQGRAGAEDERWLREQALREEIEESAGFFGSIAHLGELDERDAVLPVLRKRAGDEAAEVPEEAREWFERRVAGQAIPESRIETLAHERAQRVRDALVEQYGVAAERVALAPADASATGGQAPEVGLALGTAGARSASTPASEAAAPAS